MESTKPGFGGGLIQVLNYSSLTLRLLLVSSDTYLYPQSIPYEYRLRIDEMNCRTKYLKILTLFSDSCIFMVGFCQSCRNERKTKDQCFPNHDQKKTDARYRFKTMLVFLQMCCRNLSGCAKCWRTLPCAHTPPHSNLNMISQLLRD